MNTNEIPDAPEAPPHWDHAEATAWESGWTSGYAAALAKIAQDKATA